MDGRLYINCTPFVPTYAATMAYHRPELVPAGKSMSQYLEEDVVPYVLGTYEPNLLKFMAAHKKYAASKSDEDKAAVDLAEIPMKEIRETMKNRFGVEILSSKGVPYNLKPARFFEKDFVFPGKRIGRLDSRILGIRNFDSDPSSVTAVSGSHRPNLATVLAEANFEATARYVISTDDTWDWSGHAIDGVPTIENPPVNSVDTIPDLQYTLKLNPKMKILALVGMYDLAIPFHLTRVDMDRLSEVERRNLTLKVYPAGHSMYNTDAARIAMKADYEQFYSAAGR